LRRFWNDPQIAVAVAVSRINCLRYLLFDSFTQ